MEKLIVFAQKNDVIGAEVVSVNPERGLIWLELDSGEPALLPASLLKGADRLERDSRLRGLHGPLGLSEGSKLTVTVVDASEPSLGGRRNIKVTERPLPLGFGSVEDGGSAPKLTAEAVAATAQLFPSDKVIKAVVQSTHGQGILVNLGQHVATLPDGELRGTKRESLRKGVSVKVKVKSITSDGIVVTRQGVA